jgi:hypothetical protein
MDPTTDDGGGGVDDTVESNESTTFDANGDAVSSDIA